MNIRINFTSSETRMIVLLDAEDRTIVSGQNTGMWQTDRRTDRQNRSGYYSGLHFEQCKYAV